MAYKDKFRFKHNGLYWACDYDIGLYAWSYSTAKEVLGFYYVDILRRGYLATYSFAEGVVRTVGKFDTCEEAVAACEHDAMRIRAGGYVGTSSIGIMQPRSDNQH